MARGRFARRAALRASLAAGIAAALTAPPPARAARRSAVVAAAIAGAAQELPAAVALLPAAAPAARRGHVRWDGVAAGALAALVTRRVWPVAPRTPADIRPALTPLGGEPTEDGRGLTIVVNPSAGPSHRASPVDALRESFPDALVLEVGEGLDLDTALARAATDGRAIGIVGGDGSVSAAAAAAHRAGKPLVVVPGGTLNHLARDLGVHALEHAVAAVKEGDLVAVDVATIDGRPFLNTASFGAYSELVDAREQLEAKIGKWPALVVALVQVLRRHQPIEVDLDGVRHRLWMIFVGNCRYHPAGFAPTWRERLDDGVLDVRYVSADHPWARARLLLAVLTGRLGRSRVYTAVTARRLEVRIVAGEARLARDGETFDGSPEFTIEKQDRPLAVYVRGRP